MQPDASRRLALVTSVLEVAAGGCALAAGWLLAGAGGLLAVLAAVLVVVSWLLERR